MKHLAIGQRKASAIGLGLWQFGSREWGWGQDLGEAAARQVVRRALDVGINFFDTAELYGNGRSEEILSIALGSRRDEAIIATKVSPIHATRRGVVRAAKRSLSRLGADTIDLYQVHWPNRLVPLAWTMRGMRDLLESGQVREVGVSNFSLPLWRKAESALGRPVVSNQVQLHLLDRRPMDELVPHAQREGRLIIAYSPLAQGLLGGRYDGNNLPKDFRSADPLFSGATFEKVAPLLEELKSVARRHGATPAQIALAWLLHVPGVIAIPGARTEEQVEANAAAADIDISTDDWERLASTARAVQPRIGRSRLKRIAAWVLGA